MAILPSQHIRVLGESMIGPFCERTSHRLGMTYGLGPAGYDVRVAETISLGGHGFSLASTMERFSIPNDIIARVCDKSSWARKGVAVQNTVLEPGWRGYLTLELTNHTDFLVDIEAGSPIAQIIFERLEAPTDSPYHGRYQNQEAGPQKAR